MGDIQIIPYIPCFENKGCRPFKKRADGCRLSLFLNTNFASKREQCQTCLSIAEREQSQDRDSGINYTN